MRASHTLSVNVDCPAAAAYAFVRDPANLPRWATAFCRSVRRDGDRWVIESDMGPVEIRFVEANALGVLDHVVTTPDGQSFHNPMRVVPNDDGCTVLFTVFRFEGLSDEQFATDIATVEGDLETLRGVLTSPHGGGRMGAAGGRL